MCYGISTYDSHAEYVVTLSGWQMELIGDGLEMYMLSSERDSPLSFQGLSVAVVRFLVRQASGAGVDVGCCILAGGRTTSDITERNYVLRKTFSWLSHLCTYITAESM